MIADRYVGNPWGTDPGESCGPDEFSMIRARENRAVTYLAAFSGMTVLVHY